MKRILQLVLPHPILSVALFVTWLLMNSPFGMGSVIIALIVALLVPQSMRAIAPERVRIRKPLVVLKLIVAFFLDVMESNWNVSRLALGHRKKQRRSGFVRVPLELTNRYGLAALAMIVTGTPGTLWVQYDRYKRVLLLHVLDLDDDTDWGQLIKTRYETKLMEIFP